MQGGDVTETKREYCDTVGHPGTLQAITERESGGDEEKGDVQLGNDIECSPASTVRVHERQGICARVLWAD